TLDVAALVKAQETVTSLVDNNDGTLTYTDEDGTTTEILLSTIIDNYETVTSVSTDASAGTLSFTDEDGNTTTLDVAALVKAQETVTSLVLSADGKTLHYMNEAGLISPIDLEPVIDIFETVSTLVENTDGTFTYTSESGSTTVLDVSNLETLTSIALNPDNVHIDYTDEDGLVTQLNLSAIVNNLETNTTLAFNNTTSELTYTNEDADNPVLDLSSLKIEPWNVQGTTDDATLNTQNIYQMGNIAIGKDAAATGVALDVEGAVRGGTNHQGTVGGYSVAFGVENTASGNISTVSGGVANTATGISSVVSGGTGNTASGFNSVVSGGNSNTASKSNSTVSGGGQNIASGDTSTVSGGSNNQALGAASTVSGGGANTAFSAYEWVGGTYSTEYTPISSTIRQPGDRLFNIGSGLGENSRRDAFTILKNGKTGVGFDNFETTAFDQKLQVNGNARIAGLPAVLGNTSTDKMVVVDADGVLKSVDASAMGAAVPWNVQGTTDDATLNTQNIYQMGSIAIGKDVTFSSGGPFESDVVLDVAGAIRAGSNQQGFVGENSVAFGDGNKAEGINSMVSGGYNNSAGFNNSVITGGENNTAEALNSAVLGGINNTASGEGAIVSGGLYNTASGSLSVVSGGQFNIASEGITIVAGGSFNKALGGLSGVFGGENNTASGIRSVVTGGTGNTAFSAYEWAGGNQGTQYTPEDTRDWNPADRLFNIGRGSAGNGRHDAFTILKNGKTGVGFDNFETTAFDQKLQVNGNARIAGLPAVSGDTSTDKVVVVDADGVLKSVDGASLGSSTTAGNGLSISGSNIQLGGALTQTTEITTTATETLAVAGLQTGTSTDEVMVIDPASGVLKKVKAVMPKFFYMPSVVFDTSTGGTGLTKDLFQEYRNQFETPMVSSTGAVNSIPTLNAQELEYHITYYDTNVFANVSIDANGVLTYDIIGTPTPASFMNIVFVVK
ncbi:hypothetical protein ACQ93I_16780, partial [Salinimicrobium sp. WS361]